MGGEGESVEPKGGGLIDPTSEDQLRELGQLRK